MTQEDWARFEETLQDVRAEEADEQLKWLEAQARLQDEIEAAFAELEAELPGK